MHADPFMATPKAISYNNIQSISINRLNVIIEIQNNWKGDMDGHRTEARGMLCFDRTFNPAGCLGKDWRLLPVEERWICSGLKRAYKQFVEV